MTNTITPQITGADPQVPGWSADHERFTPDERDIALLTDRQAARLARPEMLEGDYVQFSDGQTRRVSYVNTFGEGSVQTSRGGSWHISSTGAGSFSGGLDNSVPYRSLTDTKQWRIASFWFFHHEHRTAFNAVHVKVYVRVWTCDLPAPA